MSEYNQMKDTRMDNGYENILLFDNNSYDDALIGVSNDDRAIYDYDKMVKWLVRTEGISVEDAVERIDYDIIRALPYFGDKAPIILYPLESEDTE